MTASRFEATRALGIALPFDEHATLAPPGLFPENPAWVARERDGRRIVDVLSWGFPHQVRSPKTGKISEKPVIPSLDCDDRSNRRSSQLACGV